MRRILVVVGARPNFVKVAPLIHALQTVGDLDIRLLNTGQHYDRALAGSFLELLHFPRADYELEVGSGSHAEQTAAVLIGAERVLVECAPDLVVVAGDVNSTMATALAAAKLHVPVAHVESGLRSRDRAMPEEINRIVTDAIADLLLCTSADAVENLHGEGIADDHIACVGNTMIDSLLALEPAAAELDAIEQRGLEPYRYALVTLHRPSLVDQPSLLEAALDVLTDFAQRMPVVFPVHPRTRVARRAPGLHIIEPLEYLEFVALMREARVVVTDSGGVQEETSVLGVPCLTYRATTERPVTIERGTNRLVDAEPAVLRKALEDELSRSFASPPARPSIPLWDGHAGNRAALAIQEWIA